MKKLTVAFFTVLLLSGCNSEKKVVCTQDYEQDGIKTKDKITLVAKGDVVKSIEEELLDTIDEETIALMNSLGGPDAIIEEAEKDYQGIAGFEYEVTYNKKDKVFRTYYKVNLAKADFDKLAELKFVDKGTTQISLDGTVESYESEGMACKTFE